MPPLAGVRVSKFGFVSQNRIRLPQCGIGEAGRDIRGGRAAHAQGRFAKRSHISIPRPRNNP
jgi:hypothetical protein